MLTCNKLFSEEKTKLFKKCYGEYTCYAKRKNRDTLSQTLTCYVWLLKRQIFHHISFQQLHQMGLNCQWILSAQRYAIYVFYQCAEVSNFSPFRNNQEITFVWPVTGSIYRKPSNHLEVSRVKVHDLHVSFILATQNFVPFALLLFIFNLFTVTFQCAILNFNLFRYSWNC